MFFSIHIKMSLPTILHLAKHASENPLSYLCLAQNALGYHGDRGLLSSLVGWIAGNATPSFIEGQSLSAEVTILVVLLKCSAFGVLIADARVAALAYPGLVRLAGAEYGGAV